MSAPTLLSDRYWENFRLSENDIEFLYQYLIERAEPLPATELAEALIRERIRQERQRIENERQQSDGIYMPRERYEVGQVLLFPLLGWQKGRVVAVRPGRPPEDLPPFSVIRVHFDDGTEREFAMDYPDHPLNQHPWGYEAALDETRVLSQYRDSIARAIEETLERREDFARGARRWFPRGMLADINEAHLNLAEAVLYTYKDQGPQPTRAILQAIDDLPDDPLTVFALDLAMQRDPRFDEVGPTGQVLWYLRELEPEGVRETPRWLRYRPVAYDQTQIPEALRELEVRLGDELSPEEVQDQMATQVADQNEVEWVLIYPHWRAGTLPLSGRLRHLFPTASGAERVYFTFVDADTGQTFPGWVVRPGRYVYGLGEWYRRKGLFPGARVWVRKGPQPDQVIIQARTHRPNREWVRVAQVGADGRLHISTHAVPVVADYEEHMAFVVPNPEALDVVWDRVQHEKLPIENLLVSFMRELAKLTPQAHVDAAELYAAFNLVRRSPPGPIFALLATRPWFEHVGDTYYRLRNAE
ncbi:MAG: hypothetical protein GXO36_00775 [Chloroflexi bacterium]|nr:hypothetical protein [Chloroflexota bacterium]